MRGGIVALLLMASQASATSFGSPGPHRVYSQNGEFFVFVNPDTHLHAVYAAASPGAAAWSFSNARSEFSKRAQFESFLVANDGQVVATVPWTFIRVNQMRAGVGVELWNEHGMFRTFPVADLCPDPEHTNNNGPIGQSWRTWKTGVVDRGTSFLVHTTCGTTHEFLFADGTATRHHTTLIRILWWLGTAAVVGAMVAVLVRSRRLCQPNPALQPTPQSRRG